MPSLRIDQIQMRVRFYANPQIQHGSSIRELRLSFLCLGQITFGTYQVGQETC